MCSYRFSNQQGIKTMFGGSETVQTKPLTVCLTPSAPTHRPVLFQVNFLFRNTCIKLFAYWEAVPIGFFHSEAHQRTTESEEIAAAFLSTRRKPRKYDVSQEPMLTGFGFRSHLTIKTLVVISPCHLTSFIDLEEFFLLADHLRTAKTSGIELCPPAPRTLCGHETVASDLEDVGSPQNSLCLVFETFARIRGEYYHPAIYLRR